MLTKHGISQEITQQLSSESANTLAQWIGSYTVICNQKSVKAKSDHIDWMAQGRDEETRPAVDAKAAHFSDELPFLKDVPSQIRRNAGAKWLEAMNAAKIGLRKPPKVKPKHKKRNCYVTNELFDVQAIDKHRCLIQIKRSDKKSDSGQILAGVVMPFSKEDAGKSLYISRKGSRFWVSMSYNLSLDVMSEKQVKVAVISLTDEQLSDAVVGYDLGVKRQVTSSDNIVYHLTDNAQEKLSQLDARRKRYQRTYARIARANDRIAKSNKRPRSNAEIKLQRKIAKYSEKKAAIQHNNSHHLSKQIAANTPLVAAFENMNISNLVRKPKAKQDSETGKWLKNGAVAKRGLNRAIHSVNMGQIRQFSQYKLADSGKILIKVKTHHSSQECAKCAHTEKANRPSQSEFKCMACGHTDNADNNASQVLKKRGIRYVRSDAFSKEKTARKISARRKTKKAVTVHELASSGSGDNVSLAVKRATVDEALNSRSTLDLPVIA